MPLDKNVEVSLLLDYAFEKVDKNSIAHPVKVKEEIVDLPIVLLSEYQYDKEPRFEAETGIEIIATRLKHRAIAHIIIIRVFIQHILS